MVRTKYTKPRSFQPKPRDLVLARAEKHEDGSGVLSIGDGASQEEEMESVRQLLYMKHVQELKRREEESRMKQLIKRVAAGAAAVAQARELRIKEDQESQRQKDIQLEADQERQRQKDIQLEADQKECDELYAKYEQTRLERDRRRRDEKNRKDRERRAAQRERREAERRASQTDQCGNSSQSVRERGHVPTKRRESKSEMEKRKAELKRYEAELEASQSERKKRETGRRRSSGQKRKAQHVVEQASEAQQSEVVGKEVSRFDDKADHDRHVHEHNYSQKKVKSICVVVSKVRASSDPELDDKMSQSVESGMDYQLGDHNNELYRSRSQEYQSNRGHRRDQRLDDCKRRRGRPRKQPASPVQSMPYEPRARATRSATSEEEDEFLPEFSSEPDIFLMRFGTRRFYEDSFENIAHLDARDTFKFMELVKNQTGSEDYEMARQRFLKLLGHHKATWYETSKTTDQDVEISRIHKSDLKTRKDYIAYMRIKPGGFRGIRSVPDNMELVFHLLIGRVEFTCRRRVKIMARGSHMVVPPKSFFGIKCCGHDQDAYLVFGIVYKKPPANDLDTRQQPVTALQVIPDSQPELFRMQNRRSSQT